MFKENIAYGVIILIIGFAIGALTFSINHVDKIPDIDIKSRAIRDSLLKETLLLNKKIDSLKVNNDSLILYNSRLDSTLLKSKKNDTKIRRDIMEGTADSAFTIILNHIPDSAN
jgi:hypothetical protein